MLGRFVIIYDALSDAREVWLSMRAAKGRNKVNIFETVKEAREHAARNMGKSVGARWILDLESGKTYSVAQ